MTFDELISNLDNINLNDDNQIIKIDKDKKLFSKDWISKYETFKHNNMCLILYKEEKNYIKVAEIEFINFELSDIDVIFKEINNLKKENVNLKNRISELENINKQPVISDELSTYFEYKKINFKCSIKNHPQYNIKILYEDNIFVYVSMSVNKNSDNDIFYHDDMIIKELTIFDIEKIKFKNIYQSTNPFYSYIQVLTPSFKYKIRSGVYLETIEIINLGSNINYKRGKNINFTIPEVNTFIDTKYINFSKQFENLKQFKNLKKIILFDIEVGYPNKESGNYDYYFFPLPEK